MSAIFLSENYEERVNPRDQTEKMPTKSKKHKFTMITVEQLVDIALGNPEIGSVNFNVLHSLLHVIVQQLNIQKCLVEFKGSDSERMEGLIMTAKPGPILKLTEYMIDLTDGKPYNAGKGQKVQPPSGKVRNSLLKYESDAATEGEKFGGLCFCESKKKQEKDETEKTDTAQEKYDKSKEEAVVLKRGDDPEQESDREGKKERNQDKKLAKKKKEEEEAAAAAAREKGEPGKEEEAARKKTKPCPCPCKEGYVREGKVEESKGTSGKPEETCPEQKMKATSSSYYGSESDACQTIVRVEALGERCDTWRTRPALAHESLVKLEEKVALLQDAFETLEKMPTNEELMKRTSGTNTCPQTPVKDMWQLYNLNKRVESCEGAIEKLASMIEDLVKESCNFREAMMVMADAVDSMECNEADCGKGISPCCGAGPGQPHRSQPSQAPPSQTEEIVAYPITAPNPCVAFSQATSAGPTSGELQTSEVQVSSEEVGQERPRQTSHVPEVKGFSTIGPDFFKLTTGEKFCALKESIECLMCQIKNFTDLIPMDQLAGKLCTIVTMQRQLDNFQKEWESFLQSFSNEGVPGAVAFMRTLKLDIEGVNDAILKIIDDRKQLEMTMQSITQEINLLKAIKADKETMEDLLAGKADAAIVNKKVSHDQFDAACDDLTKGLDDALERLIAQETVWNEAMEELQRDVDSKLDKVEIMPLKEFINKKLEGLQDKLKKLAQLRKDAEAAGAKSKILRNLNCIACDNNVIMRMENKNTLQHPATTPSKSMRPYIAYELDQVRKALKKGPTCRSVNQVEEMVADTRKKNIGLPFTREGVESRINKLEHYCNRYCGGSHTITTPQQRVTRIGHFLTEFGPHAMAMFNQEGLPPADCKPTDTRNLSISHKDIKLM